MGTRMCDQGPHKMPSENNVTEKKSTLIRQSVISRRACYTDRTSDTSFLHGPICTIVRSHSHVLCVASFLYEWLAYLAQGRLEIEEIEAAVVNGFTVSTCWLYSTAIGGVQLAVRPEDVARAREVLVTTFDEMLAEVEESRLPVPPEEVCPVCGRDSVGPRRYSAWGLLPSFLFGGVPIFSRLAGWKCRTCNSEGEWVSPMTPNSALHLLSACLNSSSCRVDAARWQVSATARRRRRWHGEVLCRSSASTTSSPRSTT